MQASTWGGTAIVSIAFSTASFAISFASTIVCSHLPNLHRLALIGTIFSFYNPGMAIFEGLSRTPVYSQGMYRSVSLPLSS